MLSWWLSSNSTSLSDTDCQRMFGGELSYFLIIHNQTYNEVGCQWISSLSDWCRLIWVVVSACHHNTIVIQLLSWEKVILGCLILHTTINPWLWLMKWAQKQCAHGAWLLGVSSVLMYEDKFFVSFAAYTWFIIPIGPIMAKEQCRF